jgi:hypothetical protein
MGAPRSDSWKDAERVLGFRVDRRRRYKVEGGRVLQYRVERSACMLCSPSRAELGYEPARGEGCENCDQSGEVVSRYWLPITKTGRFDWLAVELA